MRRCLAGIVLLCQLFIGAAQEPTFHLHEFGDAFSGLSINTVFQDKSGMIWLGTKNGLARYDGNQLFMVGIDSALTGEVTAIYEDVEGHLWIGTYSGKIYFLDRTRKPHAFNIQEGNPTKPVRTILQDNSGQIWFATYGEGVYVYTGARLFNIGIDDGLSSNDIYTMTIDPAGKIWLGTDDGINICSFSNEKKSIRQLGLSQGLPDQIITALQADRNGNIWIGTFEYGIVYYNATLEQIQRPFDSKGIDEVTAFEIFDDHELWIGTRKSGAWRYNPQSEFLRPVTSLSTLQKGEITSILVDVEGNIWIAMNDGYLFSAFRPFEILDTNIGEVQTLLADHRNKVWIGTKNGLYQIEEKANSQSALKRMASGYNWNITDIYEDPFHNLWIGTLDNGLFIYHPATQKVKHVRQLMTNGENSIMSMAGSKERIWLATLQGVIYYPSSRDIMQDDNIDFELIHEDWESSLHFVFQVYVDSRDRAWFATDGYGVYSIKGDSVSHYQGTDSINLRTVYSITEGTKGHLWFNIPDVGLVEFDGYNYTPLGINEGLSSTLVASIITSGTGDLVIAHQRGIDLMETERRHFMYYNDEIGISEIDAGLNAVTRDSRGHVYISGRNHIIKYYSTKNKLSIHPRTQLTQVSVYGQPVDYFSKHRFEYDQNYIAFDYVGLWYSSPQSVTYLYKLEGYDLNWKVSRDNVASYSSLPPGDYVFSIKASENKFFLDEPITSYAFTINKPFWMQWWFVGGTFIAAGFIFYWLIKARERRFNRDALLKKEVIETQLQALKAQINPHFLFNSFNTLITIIDENTRSPEVAIEYVEKLSDFFRSILQYREAESISSEEEWKLVSDFGYLLKKRYGSHLRLHIEEPPRDVCILPLTLQMLLENAVKHNIITARKPLDVYITSDEEYITVKNNLQPKSKPEPSTQFGLQSIIKRYMLMSDKKVIIEKDDSTFTVKIPIIKNKKS
jgi:ligand-binding sensor domain-containing protein